jgi:hypothetical protein
MRPASQWFCEPAGCQHDMHQEYAGQGLVGSEQHETSRPPNTPGEINVQSHVQSHSSASASSCHSEPKGWRPLRLYLFTLCIALSTTAHSDSHYSSCRSLLIALPNQEVHQWATGTGRGQAGQGGDYRVKAVGLPRWHQTIIIARIGPDCCCHALCSVLPGPESCPDHALGTYSQLVRRCTNSCCSSVASRMHPSNCLDATGRPSPGLVLSAGEAADRHY